ncbi:MAG: hypothetical protein HY033_13205 [Ignavibacteriae bacterium]|nr:hypothetical protein [Ignavibacteria bacterium]MBI3365850.1 hypothetical protein [Ignavibacteriota bacterium]
MNPKPDKTIPALYGGIIIGLVSSIPFVSFVNCFCCAGILLGGFLAVMFYKNNFTPDTPPFTAGDCMTVGVFAGIIGAIVETILSVIFVMMFGNIALQFLVELLKNSSVQIPSEAMRSLEDAIRERANAFHIMLNFFFVLVLNSIFGMLGGLIGYSMYKPKQQTMMPPPPPPPAPQLS